DHDLFRNNLESQHCDTGFFGEVSVIALEKNLLILHMTNELEWTRPHRMPTEIRIGTVRYDSNYAHCKIPQKRRKWLLQPEYDGVWVWRVDGTDQAIGVAGLGRANSAIQHRSECISDVFRSERPPVVEPDVVT